MKRLFAFVAAIVAVVVVSCNSYDDTPLWDAIRDHEARISALEELCKQMNTNIESLQSIVKAMQSNDYITSVVPVTEDGEVVGYTITFVNSAPITIYHGEDGRDGVDGSDGADGIAGKDGDTPQIGVRQDVDGVYYWTINGEWILDDEGNKVRTVGENGEDGENGANGSDGERGTDGITPQLKIESGYWYVSYNEGQTWSMLGVATGEDVVVAECIFAGVTEDDENVYFTLVDGSVITIRKYSATHRIDILFSTSEVLACYAGASVEIGYSIVGGDEDNAIEAFGNGGWDATIIKRNSTEGRIKVTAPLSGAGGKVVVLATSGAGSVVMKALYFDEGILADILDSYEVDWEATTLDVAITTNINYSVVITGGATEWLSVADTRASLRLDVVRFNVAENDKEIPRTATVELRGECGDLLRRFEITQKPNAATSVVHGAVTVSFKELGYYSCVEIGEYPGYQHFAGYVGMAVLPIELEFSAEEHGAFVWDVINRTTDVSQWSDAECVDYLMWTMQNFGVESSIYSKVVVDLNKSYELIAIVFDTEGVCSKVCRKMVDTSNSGCGNAADYIAWWEAHNGTQGGDDSGGGSEEEFTELATPVVTANVDGNTVTVSWQQVAGAKGYVVSLDGGAEEFVSDTSITYSDLAYNTAYSVAVVAIPADTIVNSNSKAGVVQFVTDVATEDGDDDDYIMLTSCAYVGDYMYAGMAEEFVLRSDDGVNVLYFNVSVLLADADYIRAGDYTIAAFGQSNYNFNMSKLSGTTIINGVEYPGGIADSSASTMSVVSECPGGIHEIWMTINSSQGTTKYYFIGMID